MANKKIPTSTLGMPNSKRQLFTYSENKLLDQITTEIMEAWRNDLITMRDVQSKCTKAANNAERAAELIEDKIPEMYKILSDKNYDFLVNKIQCNVDSIFSFCADIRKEVFQIKEKLNFDYIIKIQINIKEIEEKINKINEKLEKIQNSQNKKWWHKIFKPKTLGAS